MVVADVIRKPGAWVELCIIKPVQALAEVAPTRNVWWALMFGGLLIKETEYCVQDVTGWHKDNTQLLFD